MSSFFIYLSSFFVSIAQTPYLDGYTAGAVAIIATLVVNAFVINFIYSFKNN